MRGWWLTIVAAMLLLACDRRGPDIGKDPVSHAPSDPPLPAPSTSASAAPLPTFSGRDPFKAPNDAGPR